MPDTPKEVRAASIAALDDGWGDLLDAPEPVADGIPLPTPVPLRTRVPTKPVLRGIREESQPIDIGILVRHKLESADAVPQEVIDDDPPIDAPRVAAVPPIVDPTPAMPMLVDDDDVGLPTVVDDEPPIAAVPERIGLAPTPSEVAAAMLIPSPDLTPVPHAFAKEASAPRRIEPVATPRPIASERPQPIASERPRAPAAVGPCSARRTQILAASVVVGVLAVAAMAMRGDDDGNDPRPRTEVASTAAAATTPTRSPAVAPALAPTPRATAEPVPEPPTPPSATPTPPAPAVAPAPTETPAAVAPTPAPAAEETEPDDPFAAAEAALAAGDFLRAHELGRAAFKATRDNEAMRVMATAACQLDDGALARKAYRSLSGPQARADVFELCKSRGVDVRAKVDGYTPAELLAKARRLSDLGDPEQAYEIARDSNRAKRSGAALEIMGISACRMKNAEKAAYVAGLVGVDAHARILAECTAQGLELPREDDKG